MEAADKVIEVSFCYRLFFFTFAFQKLGYTTRHSSGNLWEYDTIRKK